MRYISVTLVALFVLAFGAWQLTADQSKSYEEITIAAYNVENMFDVFDNPYTLDEQTDIKSRDAIRSLASAIQAINADVVAFQEVENEYVLKAMVKEFLPDAGYDYVAVIPSNNDRGICNGVISRKPILSVTSHRWLEFKAPGDERTWRFARDLLKVRIAASDQQVIDLYVVHLKSKRDGKNDPQSRTWRLAEATKAREIIEAQLQRDPDAMVMILGDFNDYIDSPPLKTLTKPMGDASEPMLVNLHEGLPKEKAGTYLRGDHAGSIIDFMLASPALARAKVQDSAKVIHDEKLTAGSDHAPILATFKIEK